MARSAYLMYHELKLPGVNLCSDTLSYARYAVLEGEFVQQVALLNACNIPVQNVSQTLRSTRDNLSVTLTFDDGCQSDLRAADILEQFGFNATFYVVSKFIGQPGYLSVAQLGELVHRGFEIGCHSRTHPNLSLLDSHGLHNEIVVAKVEIEDLIGRHVSHFSCPGGFWSREAAQMASDAGFATMATSRLGLNTLHTDPYRLARVAVYQGTSLQQFERLCRGRGIRTRKGLQWLMDSSKRILGEQHYRQIRARLLAVHDHAERIVSSD